ncbi:MAG: hypothetical protein QOG94_2089 [Solirubrobacteraceae bacterium]|jgi:hypothetical protein|nr:hypothetical protein [Solirubrobacteraceae bacterium]
MTASRRLRWSNSLRTACARRRRICAGSPALATIGASGFSTATRAISAACARVNAGASAVWKRRT